MSLSVQQDTQTGDDIQEFALSSVSGVDHGVQKLWHELIVDVIGNLTLFFLDS